MDDLSYNLLMNKIKEISSQTSLLFSSNETLDSFASENSKKTPEEILKTVFGYDSFRSLQREVIQNVLDGRDTLAVMPTGGGKSLCYEIPSLIMDGITVVISPLIALMQDQVSQLESFGVPAVFLNSSLEWDQYRNACDRIRRHEVKLVYVSPEGLNTEKMQDLLHSNGISVDCITIDEAHCVSEWGHDFRPDYMEIASIRQQFPKAVCLALTATATKQVQKDIISHLNLENPAVLVASFNRPNLYLEVRRKSDSFSQVCEYISEHKNQSGIIYCFSRKQVDELAQKLKLKGISATNYHAGLSDEERTEHQKLFIQDKIDVMVCTLAFGMGINKPDVRFVIHYDLPKSVEQYYQEIGRAGRDGLPSSALLLYSAGDAHKIRWFFQEQEDSSNSERLLQGMMTYAEARVCRRQVLLSYFGERLTIKSADETECCCDICTKGPSNDIDVTIHFQKYLSCILRLHERYGASYVIDVLTGAKTARIFENNHDELSTYGIGKDLSRNDWFELNNCLIQTGYIDKTQEHSVLYLTDEGRNALRERRQIFLPVVFTGKSKTVVSKEKKPVLKVEAGDETAERIVKNLKFWRTKTADELNVPPYVIFGDKTMYDIAARKPHTKQELMQCYGIGDAKAEKFGYSILRILNEIS